MELENILGLNDEDFDKLERRGSPYDSSDLNHLRPAGCLKLEVTGKNADIYFLDSALEVSEIIQSYLPKRQNDDLIGKSQKLAKIIKSSTEGSMKIGENMNNAFVLHILNRRGVA